MARSLTARERAALDALLSIEFSGATELRVQAHGVLATRRGMIVDFVVDESLPVASAASRTPVEAVVDGEGYDGGLVLFVDDGRLSALEYWWVTEDEPGEFPPTSAIGKPIVSR